MRIDELKQYMQKQGFRVETCSKRAAHSVFRETCKDELKADIDIHDEDDEIIATVEQERYANNANGWLRYELWISNSVGLFSQDYKQMVQALYAIKAYLETPAEQRRADRHYQVKPVLAPKLSKLGLTTDATFTPEQLAKFFGEDWRYARHLFVETTTDVNIPMPIGEVSPEQFKTQCESLDTDAPVTVEITDQYVEILYNDGVLNIPVMRIPHEAKDFNAVKISFKMLSHVRFEEPYALLDLVQQLINYHK